MEIIDEASAPLFSLLSFSSPAGAGGKSLSHPPSSSSFLRPVVGKRLCAGMCHLYEAFPLSSPFLLPILFPGTSSDFRERMDGRFFLEDAL